MPIRISLKQGKLLLRPPVGLMVQVSATMSDALAQALRFKDRFQMADVDVSRILDSEVDVTCTHPGDSVSFSVTSDTVVATALIWGRFTDIEFHLAKCEQVQCSFFSVPSLTRPCVAAEATN